MVQTTIPRNIVFDVYETLPDMNEVEKKVNNLLDSKRGYCFVDTCVDQFNDFSSIARATMQMAGKMFSRDMDEKANR